MSEAASDPALLRICEAVERALASDDPAALNACLEERGRWLADAGASSSVHATRELLLEQQKLLLAHVEATRARVLDELREVRRARARIDLNRGGQPQARLVSQRT